MSKMEEMIMSERDNRAVADRRGFLKLAGLGTVAGGTALVAGEVQAEEAKESPGKLYRETEHVKTFYDTARF